MSSLITESESEHEPEPESFFRVDEYADTYLGICDDGNKLTYFTSKQPEIIPEGIEVATVDESCTGIRLIEVHKRGSESYDIVRVGTLTVVNDIAWVVGDVIAGEGPFCDNIIQVPPLASTYPIEKHGNLTRTDLFAQMREKLVAALTEQGYDPNTYDLDAVLETSDRGPRNIFSGKCRSCGHTIDYHYDGMCLATFIDGFDDLEMLEMLALEVKRLEASIANGPNLEVKRLEASKADDTCSINQQSCGGKVELDEMDIECDGCSDLATEQLSSSFRSRALIN